MTMIKAEAISAIMECVTDENTIVVSGIAFSSNILYKVKHRPRNFYMRLTMGLALSVGVGIAKARPQDKVVVIDGDGATLLNFQAIITAVNNKCNNLIFVVLDNKTYDAARNNLTEKTGTDPTPQVDIQVMAVGAGVYYAPIAIKDVSTLKSVMNEVLEVLVMNKGVTVLDIEIESGIRREDFSWDGGETMKNQDEFYKAMSK